MRKVMKRLAFAVFAIVVSVPFLSLAVYADEVWKPGSF